MEFGLLGPLTVRAGGSGVTVTAGKQRVLLAALLLRANQVVSAGELGRFVWDGSPPETARVTLQNYIKRLRQALGQIGPERIVTRPAGYLIELEPGELDVTRFGELQAAGRAAARAGAWEEASAQLGAALAMWRGQPLVDVPSQALALAEVPRLEEMRLDAVEARIDADLHLGRHQELVSELQSLTAAEPLREGLHELLMLALYRSGQQAAALAVYRHARQQLIDEVGIEPGPGLRRLNQQILQSDPALLLHSSAPVATWRATTEPAVSDGEPASPPYSEATVDDGGVVPVVSGPDLLPAGVAGFAGRVRELRALSAMTSPGHGPPAITAIGGTAGVGKTALAVHWARQHARRFPGGQLYVNLRGFGPADPLPPAEALRGFLDALAVPPAQIPATLERRQALYRSLIAGRKILILLDNARDPDQIRPLLPATPTALVLVTSRDELTGLVAADGAGPLALDVLTETDARELLARRLESGRLAAEPAAAAELITLCARLPLALAITAARAAAHPTFPLTALAAELRDARGRLDALDLGAGSDSADARALFSWSYRDLSPAAARMFRLLGIHPGPDITAPAAASLAGLDLPEARRLLRELARGHLIAESRPGRFAFHDLLRAYAAEQARAVESGEDLRAATGRALDHYLFTAHAAALLLNRAQELAELATPRPGVAPEQLAGRQQALAWFEAEHRVLSAAAVLAAEAGFDSHAWRPALAILDDLRHPDAGRAGRQVWPFAARSQAALELAGLRR